MIAGARTLLLASTLLLAACARSPQVPLAQLDRWAEGWVETGHAVIEKDIAVLSVDAYRISHFVRRVPAAPSRATMIALDEDKRFVLQMLRDVGRDDLVAAIREAYARNGYANGPKVERCLGAFGRALREGEVIVIDYHASTKTTSIRIAGGPSTEIEGDDFMRGTWSIWFGRIDPESVGDELVSALR